MSLDKINNEEIDSSFAKEDEAFEKSFQARLKAERTKEEDAIAKEADEILLQECKGVLNKIFSGQFSKKFEFDSEPKSNEKNHREGLILKDGKVIIRNHNSAGYAKVTYSSENSYQPDVNDGATKQTFVSTVREAIPLLLLLSDKVPDSQRPKITKEKFSYHIPARQSTSCYESTESHKGAYTSESLVYPSVEAFAENLNSFVDEKDRKRNMADIVKEVEANRSQGRG